MKKAIKTRWIRALRSGKYKQGRGHLRTNRGGFCCLGVLTDLYIKTKGTLEEKREWKRMRSLGGEAGTLPSKVQKWSGIRDRNPSCEVPKHGITDLATLNDDTRMGFVGIAKVIKEQL